MSMISRPDGVLSAALGGQVVVYDPATESGHILDGPVAAWLLSLDAPVRRDALVAEISATNGVDPAQVSSAVTATLELFTSLGLGGSGSSLSVPEPWPGSSLAAADRLVGAPHPVIGRTLAFRSRDPHLLAELDRFFGTAPEGTEPTVFVDADPGPDGDVLVTAAQEWDFPSRADCVTQIMNVVNEYGARSNDMVVLHSAGVRTPDGEVWLIPGAIDAGKSTLAAALVRAGCDYLGDESIGIRADTLEAVGYPKALTLDTSSRGVVGLPSNGIPHTELSEIRADAVALAAGDVPVTRVLLSSYRPDRPESVQQLDRHDALKALMANTLNLLRSGDDGLQALCDLAVAVPVTSVVHHDAVALAAELLGPASPVH